MIIIRYSRGHQGKIRVGSHVVVSVLEVQPLCLEGTLVSATPLES